MPCYNTQAADRYAEEQGQLADLELQTEQEIEDLLEKFQCGHDSPFAPFDDVLDELYSNRRLDYLIHRAWETGDYTCLGENIRDDLLDTAERQLSAAKYDIEDYLRHHPEPSDGEVPA